MRLILNVFIIMNDFNCRHKIGFCFICQLIACGARLEFSTGYHDKIVLSSDSCPILDVFNPDEIIASPCFLFLCFSSHRQLD